MLEIVAGCALGIALAVLSRTSRTLRFVPLVGALVGLGLVILVDTESPWSVFGMALACSAGIAVAVLSVPTLLRHP